jgi:uncharacterized membrane protein
MKSKLDKEILDAMSKDPGNWKGPFYFNRKDYRILVPKYYSSMGWTLNFASPYSYLSLISIIIIIIGFIFIF